MNTEEIIKRTVIIDATPKPVSREEFEALKARLEKIEDRVRECFPDIR